MQHGIPTKLKEHDTIQYVYSFTIRESLLLNNTAESVLNGWGNGGPFLPNTRSAN